MLQYELPVAGAATLRIYDVAGRIVRELSAGHSLAGLHAARWDGLDAHGRRAANGVYIARLETTLGTSTVRVTLVR